MKTYNVALNQGIDYDAFWNEIETDGSGSTYVPNRSVSIVNERPNSLRQCWYELSDAEAEKLRNDPRVYCVEIPPEHRTDIEITPTTTQTGLYYKGPNTGSNPNNNLGINWGLFRLNSRTNNTTSNSGTLNYDYNLDGTGVDVVIMDSGCQVNHPDFNDASGNSRVQQIDWYAANGYPPYPIGPLMPPYFYTDYDGHGTHCTGISAGTTYGRAKNSRIYIMTLSGLCEPPTNGISDTTAFDLIKGWHNNKPIDPLTGYKRPTVVNMSWAYTSSFANITGGNYRGTTWTGTTKQSQYGMIGNASNRFGVRVDSIDVDVSELIAAGVVLVGAAGNFYQTIDVFGGTDYNNYFTSSISGNIKYMQGASPSSSLDVICVGNVDSDAQSGTTEQKASSSESGPRVDVWSPGTYIVSTTSNTNLYGATTFYPTNSSFYIMTISGTSMACPNIVGLCAQLLQLYPGYTPSQIRALVIANSTSNVLYSTGLSTDYSDSRSLHGGPNRFAYQAPTNTLNITGAIRMTNVSINI